MGQTPSVRPDESKVTEPELSMPEITSGNSQGMPVDNNTSVFRAAKMKFKIKILHAIIGLIAIGVVLLAIFIGLLFSEISIMKDQHSKQEENLNGNKAAIAELKAKDVKTKATIAAKEADLKANKATITSLESQLKLKDSQIMKSVNRLKQFEVGRHVSCTRDHNDEDCMKRDRCSLFKIIPFEQSYDTTPLVAVMMDSKADESHTSNWALTVTSVQKSNFTVLCEKHGTRNALQQLHFTWISLPKV